MAIPGFVPKAVRIPSVSFQNSLDKIKGLEEEILEGLKHPRSRRRFWLRKYRQKARFAIFAGRQASIHSRREYWDCASRITKGEHNRRTVPKEGIDQNLYYRWSQEFQLLFCELIEYFK
jgi:hypothetical protein